WTVAFGLKAAAPCGTVVFPVGVVAELAAVVVELGVEAPCVVSLVVTGSGGTVGKVTPGRDTGGKGVVTQPTTGRQSCGAAGALLVNAPARSRPAAQIPAPPMTRAAMARLGRTGVGRREVMASLFFRLGGCLRLSTSADNNCIKLPPKG